MIIYLLRNKLNGKCYVGQTCRTLGDRISGHRSASRIGDSPIYRAIRKYGWENFDVEVLEECQDQAELDMAERFWIRCYNSMVPNGYNAMTGGNLGRTVSAETRQKLSDMRKGRVPSEAHRAALSRAATNKSVEWLNKIGLANSGERNGQAQLTWAKVEAIRAEAATGKTQREIAASFGISRSLVGLIIQGKRWKRLPERA